VFPLFFSFVGVVSKVGQCAVVGTTYETRSSFVFPFLFSSGLLGGSVARWLSG
jgi:predicted RND superfamily exporter protein